jgi:phospholipid transport system substrate-binding protein
MNVVKKVKVAIFVFIMLLGVSAFAGDPAPLAMLKNVSNQMLTELDKHSGALKKNDKFVNSLVNRVLVPHFDLMGMCRSVIGREYWEKASSDTQQQFVKEFTYYVIRTYSSALQSYDGEKIEFFPIRGSIGDRVQINSNLLLKNGPPIQLQYRLVQKSGNWLIYDFSVDGVSIVKNYNSQFAGTLRQSGLAVLVKKLHDNNMRTRR